MHFDIPRYLQFPTSPFDISWVILISKAKIGLQWAGKTKKLINYHIKGLYKTTCYKTKSKFSLFFLFSLTAVEVFFTLSLWSRFSNFEKLVRFHWQAFIPYKNRQNLKMLKEIFCQKLIVSNVILVFLDHLKRKIFFVGQPRWQTESASPLFKISGSAPAFPFFMLFVHPYQTIFSIFVFLI